MQVALIALVYRKSLLLDSASFLSVTTGQVVNLISNDAFKFEQASIFVHFLWNAPVELCVALYLLWQEIGPASLMGFGIM